MCFKFMDRDKMIRKGKKKMGTDEVSEFLQFSPKAASVTAAKATGNLVLIFSQVMDDN